MIAWYALRTKANKEDVVWRQAVAEGIEVFYPRIHVKPVNPRARKVKPFFPNYLFVEVDLDETRVTLFKWMPDAVGLVSFDGHPARVDESFVDALKAYLERLNQAGGVVYEGLKPGDAVVIRNGPFAGYDAVFDAALPGKERVRVLLMILGRQAVPVEMESARIKPRK